MVEYRQVPGYPNYMAGDDGSVWRRMIQHQSKTDKKHGRLSVNVYNEHGQRAARVHHLVLEAFVGPRPEGMECCHGPGGALDNSLKNLRWDTPEENRLDVERFGKGRPRGEKAAQAKFTNRQVVEMAKMLINGHSNQEIARKFGAKFSTVSLINVGHIWNHITGASQSFPLRRKWSCNALSGIKK